MFISIQEIYTHLYPESIRSISGQDEEDLIFALDAAIGEVKGYLHAYDTNKLFSAEGKQRNAYLLLMVKNVAVWHYINKANPNIDYNDRLYRYETTKKDLVDIQRGNSVPDFPKLENEDGSQVNTSQFAFMSNPKRTNHV